MRRELLKIFRARLRFGASPEGGGIPTSPPGSGGATPAASTARYEEVSQLQDQIITGPEEEDTPVTQDSYKDGTMTPLEQELRTTTAERDLGAYVSSEGASSFQSTTPAKLREDASNKQKAEPDTHRPGRPEAELGRVFLEGTTPGRIDIQPNQHGPKDQYGQPTTFIIKGQGVDNISNIFVYTPAGGFQLKEGHTEREITDDDLRAFFHLAVGDIKDLPEAQQLAIGDYFLRHQKGNLKGKTKDRSQIVADLFKSATPSQGSQGSQASGSQFPPHLTDPLQFAGKHLEGKGRDKAMKAFKERIDSDELTDAQIWNIAYRSQFYDNPQTFMDSLEPEGKRATTYKDLEKLATREEDPIIAGPEAFLDQMRKRQEASEAAYTEAKKETGDDILTGEAYVKMGEWDAEQKEAKAAVNAVKKETESEADFMAYCKAMGLNKKDDGTLMTDAELSTAYTTTTTSQKEAWNAARQQHAMRAEGSALTTALATAAKAQTTLETFTTARETRVELDKAKAEINKIKDPKQKKAASDKLAKKEAKSKIFLEKAQFEDGTPILDSAATTALTGDDEAYGAHLTTLTNAETAAATALQTQVIAYNELEAKGHYETLKKSHKEMTTQLTAATERIAASDLSEAQAVALYEQDLIHREGGLIDGETNAGLDISISLGAAQDLEKNKKRLVEIDEKLGSSSISDTEKVTLRREQERLQKENNILLAGIKKNHKALGEAIASNNADQIAQAKAVLEAEASRHRAEAKRLGERYIELDKSGHHSERVEGLDRMRGDIVSLYGDAYHALEKGDKKALDKLAYPRDQDGNPIYKDLPEYEVTLTTKGEDIHEENSKLTKFNKKANKVLDTAALPGKAISAVTSPIESVAQLIKTLKPTEDGAALKASIEAMRTERKKYLDAVSGRATATGENTFAARLQKRIDQMRKDSTGEGSAKAQLAKRAEKTRKERIEGYYKGILGADDGFTSVGSEEEEKAKAAAEAKKLDADAQRADAQAQITENRLYRKV